MILKRERGQCILAREQNIFGTNPCEGGVPFAEMTSQGTNRIFCLIIFSVTLGTDIYAD